MSLETLEKITQEADTRFRCCAFLAVFSRCDLLDTEDLVHIHSSLGYPFYHTETSRLKNSSLAKLVHISFGRGVCLGQHVALIDLLVLGFPQLSRKGPEVILKWGVVEEEWSRDQWDWVR